MGQHNSSQAVCPAPDTNGPDLQPLSGNLTFQKLAAYISGAVLIFSGFIALIITVLHATQFSDPSRQRQIIRIAWMPPSFALICFLACCFNDNTALYITPGIDVFEAVAMAAFFLLLTEYVGRNGDLDGFFMEAKQEVPAQGSAVWYQKLAFGVTQWVVVSVLLWIATAASLAAGTYCDTSTNIHFAHIWITIIRAISVVMAVTSILTFYRRTSRASKPHGALKQFFNFKSIVFLNFIQTFIFNILRGHNALHPTSSLSYNDLYNSIPALLLSFEIALICPIFLFTFPSRPYKIRHGEHGPKDYYGGVLGLGAIFDAINISDIFIALGNGLQAKMADRNSQRQRYAPPPQNYYGLNDNEGQFYPDRSRERLYPDQELQQGFPQRH